MNVASVQEVRNRSFAPLNECRSALQEAGGDVEKALVVLQKRGVLRAQASAVREAREGIIHSYVHGGKIAVLVEVNCETDFAARNPLFRKFVDDVAMHIAAASPSLVSRENDPDPQKMRTIFEHQVKESGKPEAAWAKIVDGKMNKHYSEICLLEQESVVVPKRTVEQLRAELSSQLGENVVIRRFTRWELGS